MLSVYTRHHADCKNAGDKAWRPLASKKFVNTRPYWPQNLRLKREKA